jgi:hypothetical protein
MMTKHELVVLALALAETVKEAGRQGVPGGILFVGVMQKYPNMTATEFEGIMDVVCKVTGIQKRGDQYFPKGS